METLLEAPDSRLNRQKKESVNLKSSHLKSYGVWQEKERNEEKWTEPTELTEHHQCINIHILGVSGERGASERLFEEIMTENFLN